MDSVQQLIRRPVNFMVVCLIQFGANIKTGDFLLNDIRSDGDRESHDAVIIIDRGFRGFEHKGAHNQYLVVKLGIVGSSSTVKTIQATMEAEKSKATSQSATNALKPVDDDDYHHQDEEDTDANNTSEGGFVTPHEEIKIGRQESRYVLYTRGLMILVLLAVAVTISLVVYRYSSGVEQDNLETSFAAIANKLIAEFIGGSSRRISALEGFSDYITTYALANNKTTHWPNVALPEFERLARRSMELSDVLSVTLLPIVSSAQRESWEKFSVENDFWVQEGLDFQGIPEDEYNQEWLDDIADVVGKPPDGVPERIFRVSGDGPYEETGPGPYAPWWQFAPVWPYLGIVNYNTFSYTLRGQILQSVIDGQKSIVTEAWDYGSDDMAYGRVATTNLFLFHGGNSDAYDPGPGSDIYVPVFDTYDSESKKVVAELSAYVYWQTYFEDILAEHDIGVYVILQNSCNQSFTFRIDAEEAMYLGEGDLHSQDFDGHGYFSEFGSFMGVESSAIEDLVDGQCLYRIAVYPSQDLEELFLSNDPKRFAVILLSTVVFTSVIFLLYDFLVERRQKVVLQTAVKSTAVVDSLFPAGVRDRLYTKANQSGTPKTSLSSEPVLPEEQEDPTAIADLYPDCTVQFCDLVGFTNWSSTREPRDVFKLLETMYKAFDKTAKRLDVFKVETVGDCYVAATGLPHAQPDHAVLMAKFAADCLLKVGTVTHRLADQLGADTAELTVRIGIHSGPVTAGVLRGAKARFQLFGDTVNTAARVESTGKPSRIQLSAATAELLTSAGHATWVTLREDHVTAKGKGMLQTYWLDPSSVTRSKSFDFELSTSGVSTGESEG